MKRAGKLLGALAGVLLVGSVCFSDTMVAQAAKGDLCLDSLSEGVASVLQPESLSASDLIQETAQSLNLDLLFDFSEASKDCLVLLLSFSIWTCILGSSESILLNSS